MPKHMIWAAGCAVIIGGLINERPVWQITLAVIIVTIWVMILGL